jgi:hypothetical protein
LKSDLPPKVEAQLLSKLWHFERTFLIESYILKRTSRTFSCD